MISSTFSRLEAESNSSEMCGVHEIEGFEWVLAVISLFRDGEGIKLRGFEWV